MISIYHYCVLKVNTGASSGFVNTDDRSLTEVFKLFDVIHILTTDHMTVTRIAKEVCLLAWCLLSKFYYTKFIGFAFTEASSDCRLLKILHQKMLSIWN